MLSRGAKEIKRSFGIPPADHSNTESIEPQNEYVDRLAPRRKEFLANLDENDVDEAAEIHRDQILQEFRSMCEMSGIDPETISSWPRICDICSDEQVFAEAMDNYSKWGISQEEADTPMTAYALGRITAPLIEMFERRDGEDNYFDSKAKDLDPNDPERVKALLAVRSIANGS